MRWLSGLLLLVALSAQAEQFGSVTVARVTSVYDADTFRVDISDWPAVVGENMSVRVKGVDAPEIRGRCEDEKQRARQARDYTASLLANAHQIELRAIERGKYFRLLAEVWIDQRSLADLLIQAGYARPYAGETRQGWCGA